MGIKEKIQVGIGDKLEGSEQDRDKLINLWYGIYLKDKISKALIKCKLFQKVERRKNQDVFTFISNFN